MNNNENEINSRETTKKCSKCGEIKLLSEFCNQKKGKNGIHSNCRLCVREYSREYYRECKLGGNIRKRPSEYNKKINSNTPEYRKQYHKQWEIDNPGYHKIQSKQWLLDNPGYNNKYNIDRRKNDIEFRLSNILRCTIYNRLKNNIKSKKSKKSIELLGCEIDFYRQYLESKFLPEMNWNNWGDVWEIDHIIPVSSFNLIIEEEQQKCFNYLNTQPLFKTTEIAESFGYIGYIGNKNKHNS